MRLSYTTARNVISFLECSRPAPTGDDRVRLPVHSTDSSSARSRRLILVRQPLLADAPRAKLDYYPRHRRSRASIACTLRRANVTTDDDISTTVRRHTAWPFLHPVCSTVLCRPTLLTHVQAYEDSNDGGSGPVHVRPAGQRKTGKYCAHAKNFTYNAHCW